MTRRRLVLAVLLLASGLGACGAPAGPQVQAEEVWARPAMAMGESGGSAGEGQAQGTGRGMAGTGAIFMRLVNEGSEPDRLLGGKTDVATAVEVHETIVEGDVTRMQMLAAGLEIPAQSEVLLEPGSYHVMLIGIQRDLKAGDRFTVELQFARSDPLTVEAEIREP